MSAIIERTTGYTQQRVGRPRANPRPLSRPPEEEILVVAARLFAEKGFAATSTREIAEAAGLRQPSLFHYYPKKERILETLLRRVAEWSLTFAEQLDGLGAPASHKLYRLLHFDVRSACASPYPVHAIALMPEARQQSFPAYWAADQRLTDIVEQLLRHAIADGELIDTDVTLCARSLRTLAGAAATWACSAGRDADELATHLADRELRGLLSDPERLSTVRQGALSLRI
ncbi:MAG: TetR/AcrR family transcriptional regulator [Myxococcales bacterium]|jgi:AcrR family transcriptional regulator